MLDSSNLLGPTASATASSASLSLESRIQALFNISVNPETPAENKPTDAPLPVNEPEINSPQIAPLVSPLPKVPVAVSNSPAANPVRLLILSKLFKKSKFLVIFLF